MHYKTQSKKNLRRVFLKKRKSLSPLEQQERSSDIIKSLQSLPDFSPGKKILAYMSIQGEVNLRPLLDILWEQKADVFLPRCVPQTKGIMEVACVRGMNDLSFGTYGILEPHPEKCPAVASFSPDIVLVPGLAFDTEGYRLGFGHGFYDRFFETCQQSAKLYGIAYCFQVVCSLPHDPWDIPLHSIVTEKDIIWV